MPARRTIYLDLPALVIHDKQLGLSRIITAMIAKLIVDHEPEIREFLNENEPNIEQERENREVLRVETRTRLAGQ